MTTSPSQTQDCIYIDPCMSLLSLRSRPSFRDFMTWVKEGQPADIIHINVHRCAYWIRPILNSRIHPIMFMLDLLSRMDPQSIYSKTVVQQKAKSRNCWRVPPPQEAGLSATFSDGMERDTSQSRLPRGNGLGGNTLTACKQVSPRSPILSTQAKSAQMIRAPALVRLGDRFIFQNLYRYILPQLTHSLSWMDKELPHHQTSFFEITHSQSQDAAFFQWHQITRDTTSSPSYQNFPPIFASTGFKSFTNIFTTLKVSFRFLGQNKAKNHQRS